MHLNFFVYNLSSISLNYLIVINTYLVHTNLRFVGYTRKMKSALNKHVPEGASMDERRKLFSIIFNLSSVLER